VSALRLALTVAMVSLAAQPARCASEPAPPCTAAEHRQFDFWLGDWDVYVGDELVGTNRIETILDGCALRESWVGSSGMRGTSLNAYSARDGRWHQSWIDSNGLLLELSGRLEEGRMALAGRVPRPDGEGEALHRIAWEPRADGTVRQHWQVSRDAGASWSDIFDGVYRPRRGDRPAPDLGRREPAAASAEESDRAAIVALIEATEAANNAGDVAGWVGLFADDAVYMAPGAPAVTTRDGLVEVARAGFRHRAAIDMTPVEIEVVGDWAFAWLKVGGSVALAGSNEVVAVNVKEIVVYRRDETGAWRIARLISNSDGE
jgi:uncharacterized protein (TIGR02246 family)